MRPGDRWPALRDLASPGCAPCLFPVVAAPTRRLSDEGDRHILGGWALAAGRERGPATVAAGRLTRGVTWGVTWGVALALPFDWTLTLTFDGAAGRCVASPSRAAGPGAAGSLPAGPLAESAPVADRANGSVRSPVSVTLVSVVGMDTMGDGPESGSEYGDHRRCREHGGADRYRGHLAGEQAPRGTEPAREQRHQDRRQEAERSVEAAFQGRQRGGRCASSPGPHGVVSATTTARIAGSKPARPSGPRSSGAGPAPGVRRHDGPRRCSGRLGARHGSPGRGSEQVAGPPKSAVDGHDDRSGSQPEDAAGVPASRPRTTRNATISATSSGSRAIRPTAVSADNRSPPRAARLAPTASRAASSSMASKIESGRRSVCRRRRAASSRAIRATCTRNTCSSPDACPRSRATRTQVAAETSSVSRGAVICR